MKSNAPLCLLLALVSGCQHLSYAERGAGLGAVTGALSGAAIGHHGGETAAGALIGTTVGALAGAALGDTVDHEVARSQAAIEARLGRQLAGAVTVPDIVAMSQAGLSDNVVTTHIRAHGVARPPGVDDLIALRDAGVSDQVIQAMQQSPPPQIPATAVPSGPIIIEEHHFVGPPAPYWPHHHGHHARHGYRPGVHWGVSFGH